MQRRGDGLGRQRARAEWTERNLRGEQIASAGGVNHRTQKTLCTSELLRQARSLRSLEAAWRSVRTNGLASNSEVVRSEIKKFDEDASRNLRSLQSRSGHGTFKIPPARGIPIPKPGKGIRPIVLAAVQPRIVQRAILDVLQGVDALQPYFRNPYSFGGIKRKKDDPLAAVPAAIKAVLDAIGEGGRFVACADISGFLCGSRKSGVANIVDRAINDLQFLPLFEQAIRVELANLANSANTLIGSRQRTWGSHREMHCLHCSVNIILANFDQVMNNSDCRCICYIGDFIIVGLKNSL